MGPNRSGPGAAGRRSHRPGPLRAGHPPRPRRFPHREDLRRLGRRPVLDPGPAQSALRTLEWIGRHENLVVCGPSGTGKTFLLEALGQAAVETGRHVAWFTLEQLGVLIRRHRADDSLTRAITRILRADLVVVDDIGLLPVGLDAAEGLYRLADAAYERRSVAVSSNLHPPGFDELMPKTLATATVGSCTTLTSARPPATASACPRPSPERE